MKKGIKIGGITLGVILLLMLLLPMAFQGKIAQLVKTEGNKMLNARFDFDDLSISLFRNFPQASVTLEGFWLKGTGPFESDTLVQAGEVTAAVNLLSLLGDSGYDISKISLQNIRLHAIVLEDGQVNWDIMKPDSAATSEVSQPEEAASPFRVKLQKFEIEHMNLVYDDRQGGLYACVEDFDAICRGDLGGERTMLELEAETEALTFRMGGIPFLNRANIEAELNIDADLVNNKFALKENKIRLNAIEAGIDGWMTMGDPAVDMDLKLKTNDIGFKEILSLVPAIYTTEFSSLKTDGMANLTAWAKGTLSGDTIPAFEVDMQVKDAMFRYPDLPAGVDHINLHVRANNPGGNADLTTVEVNPLNFTLSDNPFSLVAEIKTPVSDPEFKIAAKGILNLGMVKQVYPLEDMELNGMVNADMQTAGRLSYIEREQYDRITASGTIGLNDMKLKLEDMPDVEIQKSLFTFTPRYLQLSETTVKVGENDLTTDSRFENYMGYVLKGTTLKGHLNISSNRFDLNDFMGETEDVEEDDDPTANEAKAVPQDTVQTATDALVIPKNIDFTMQTRMKQVLLDKMSFNNVEGTLLVKGGKVDMKNLSMNTMGGNVLMNGYYSTADPTKPEMKGGFKLNNISFAQAYKELDMVRKMAPIFENLKGNFSGGINIFTLLGDDMSPVLQSMQGDGNLSTRDLNLSGVKVIDQIADAVNKPALKQMNVKDMNVNFAIEEGRIHTQPFDIKVADYNLNLSGSTGLDQTIDYQGKIQLPASTGGLSQLTTFDLKIGGSFTSPRVSVDTKSMATQAVQSVATQAASKLGQKLGLDSAATANKDTLKKEVTKKALDFLKKLK